MQAITHLVCSSCDDNPSVARFDGVAKLVCHCTHADGDLDPVPIGDMSILPEPWSFESNRGNDHEVRADGGVDQPDPTEDPAACSMCGCHIGYGGSDEYCDGCARDVGAKPPMRTCMGCGQTGPEEQMETVDVSPEDEYYPDIKYLCRSCGGGD